jgi:hypothetical protein
MPDLHTTDMVGRTGPDDPIDRRLERAVHAYADRASVRVDAAAVARQASAGGRRFGAWAFLGREVPVPAAALVALLLLLVALALTLSAGGMPIRLAAEDVRVAIPAEPLPTIEPLPLTDGEGDEVVGGTETVSLAADGTLAVTTTMNDARITGTGTWRFTTASGAGVATMTGPFHLEAADGAWDGTCTGAAWDGLHDIAADCWLAGSGAYEGLAWYRQSRWRFADHWDFTGGNSRGVITPGEPPAS